MPELPEVEVLVRHLAPQLQDQTIGAVHVPRSTVLGTVSPDRFMRTLQGAKFTGLSRRGKYLVFRLRAWKRSEPLLMVGHLGMTGRMYLLPAKAPLPRHTAAVLKLGREQFVFEDTRRFGRLTFDTGALARLGPEPLSDDFKVELFAQALKRSGQSIKIRLLDQSLVAGVGNIYASEALFRAGISPTLPARGLTLRQVENLWLALREVLSFAIECGSTVPLNYSGLGGRDQLFYFGRAPGTPDSYEERLQVYDRAGQPCRNCGTLIRRRVQAARSTYYCPHCQRRGA